MTDLAYIAATIGGLADALDVEQIDEELFTAAGDIISALITGGPAEDIDDYAEGPRAFDLSLRHARQRARQLDDLLYVHDIARFLEQDTDWDARELRGWTTAVREQLGAECAAIISRPRWRELVADGLDTRDGTAFYTAELAARFLGIPTLPAWRRMLHDRADVADADIRPAVNAATQAARSVVWNSSVTRPRYRPCAVRRPTATRTVMLIGNHDVPMLYLAGDVVKPWRQSSSM